MPAEMPAPAVTRETLPFWQAAAEHRLVVQTCAACGRVRHPPGPTCPSCRSFEHRWTEVSGRGRVYTYTIVHQAFVPALAAFVPYVVAAVELDDAPEVRLITNLVEIDPALVTVGLPMELVWDDVRPGLALPRFRPRGGGSAAGA
jgi:uncharacterized OB-fold protein